MSVIHRTMNMRFALVTLLSGFLFSALVTAQEQTKQSGSESQQEVRTWRGYNPMRLVQPNVPIENRSILQYFSDSARHLIVEVGTDGKVIAASTHDSIPDQKSIWTTICSQFQFDLLGDEQQGTSRRTVVLRITPDEIGRNLRARAPYTIGRPLDYRLLALSLRQAGIELPKVLLFPSFYPVRQSPDSLLLPPVVLLKIDLDALGRVLSSEVVSSTVPGISPHIEAAGLRARVTSPKNTSSQGNSAYLLVHLLSSGVSPVPPVSDSTAHEWFGFPRVVILPDRPDSAELLCAPLPKVDFRTLHWVECGGQPSVVPAKIVITKDGETRIYVDMKVNRQLRAKMEKRLHEIRFFPAILTSGEAIDWRGTMRFEFAADGKLQVQPDWY